MIIFLSPQIFSSGKSGKSVDGVFRRDKMADRSGGSAAREAANSARR
jgi:hypothetical protein